MIGKLTGILGDKNPPEVLVDCHGVNTTLRMILRQMERRPWRTLLSVTGVIAIVTAR